MARAVHQGERLEGFFCFVWLSKVHKFSASPRLLVVLANLCTPLCLQSSVKSAATQDRDHSLTIVISSLRAFFRMIKSWVHPAQSSRTELMEDEVPSLEDTVFLIVGLKVFIHATGVGHLFAINLWEKLGVVNSLLLIEEDVGRVGVDLL